MAGNRSTSMSDAPESNPATLFDTRILYVVLQGEFALYHEIDKADDPDHLWIVAPELHGHVYKAGPWVTEDGTPTDWSRAPEIQCHNLELRHAVGDAKSTVDGRHRSGSIPEENVDTFMRVWEQNPGNGRSDRRARARELARLSIRVPMPLAILPGLIQTSESVFVQVKEQNGSYTYPPVPHNPAVIQILVYKWYKGRRPYLWGETGSESIHYTIESGGSEQYQSIQIYASSEKEEQENGRKKHQKHHAQLAFHKAAELLGVNADIDWKDDNAWWEPDGNACPGSICSPKPAVPPPGLSWHQINSFLFEVERIWDEQDERQELLYDRQVIRGTGVSGSGDCGPITGGGGG
jgi:hypothetical protein